MIIINKFTTSSDCSSIDVSVETDEGFVITSAIVWTDKTFKDYNQAIDVSSYLSGVTNVENFTILASDLNTEILNGIYFIEFETTSNVEDDECDGCSNSLGVATCLIPFKQCLINKILEYNICEDSSCEDPILCSIYNIHILIEALVRSLEFGYYGEAIDILSTLRKLCKNAEGCIDCNSCQECDDLPTPTFKSGLDYGTLDGTLTLI